MCRTAAVLRFKNAKNNPVRVLKRRLCNRDVADWLVGWLVGRLAGVSAGNSETGLWDAVVEGVVGWVCFVCCSLRSIRRTPSQLHSLQQIPTQHDILPQHLVYKNEQNREYVITLARNDETPQRVPHCVAYDAHLANYTLYNRFLHNMICWHNTLFTKTN